MAQRVPEGLDSQIFMTFGTEGGEVISLKRWLPLPPENVPFTHFQ